MNTYPIPYNLQKPQLYTYVNITEGLVKEDVYITNQAENLRGRLKSFTMREMCPLCNGYREVPVV